MPSLRLLVGCIPLQLSAQHRRPATGRSPGRRARERPPFPLSRIQLPRKTFVEQVPMLAARYARRTRRLSCDLEFIGLALGGRPGSRLPWRQHKPTNRMTLLRLVRALPEPPIETPRELGVDEFAFRRGRRYGTILVNADTHDVIDLLEDPSADALVSWLDDHPGVQVICRDRDGVYASAATRSAPDAMQVADRWHIVHNLAAALERMAVRVLAPLHKQHAADALAKLDKQRNETDLPTQAASRCETNVVTPRSTPSATRVWRLRRLQINCTSIAERYGSFWQSVRPRNCADLWARARADLIGSPRTLSAAGRKVARSPPISTMSFAPWASVEASDRSDDSWRVGVDRSRHHPYAGYCPVRRRCAGYYCGAARTWTTPSGCC